MQNVSVTDSCKMALCATVLLSLLSPSAVAGSQAEVDRLSVRCEDAREQQLAPIRKQKTRSCKEQQIRAPDHCERYYTTYGNTSITGGVRRAGMFYDLPECVAYLDAREALQSGRSRNK